MRIRSAFFVSAVTTILAASLPAWAQSPMNAAPGGMNMKMNMSDKPVHFAPTRAAYTTNHLFLVKLLAVPRPIPFEKYFHLRFAVYDGKHPSAEIDGAKITIFVGMRHGLKHGFAHGMESTPKIVAAKDAFTVSGMYFHMMGPWVLKATVTKGKERGVAYFDLPCCGT